MRKQFVIVVASIAGMLAGCSDTYEVLSTRLPDSGATTDAGPSADAGSLDVGVDVGDDAADMSIDFGMPETPPIIPDISHIGAGTEHTCLLADGRIMCAGSDAFDATATDVALTEFTQIDPRQDWVALDTHRYTNCAMNQAREIWCWGHNDYGQAGGGTERTVPEPTQIDLPGPATSFSVGDRISCAIVGPFLYCWGGDADYALLGDNTGEVFGPIRIPLPERPDAVESGRSNVCVRADTRVYCWGRNDNKMLSIDIREPVTEPTRVYETDEWSDIRLSIDHLCMRSMTGNVVCSGRNAARQISNRTVVSLKAPTESGMFGDQHSAGEFNTCAIDAGVLSCRGLNSSGQLNDPPLGVDDYRDVTIVGDGGYQLVSAGSAHICATKPGRIVHCWGTGDSGRLGALVLGPNPTTIESILPEP